MGKALEEIDILVRAVVNRLERGEYGEAMRETLFILQGQRAVIIALEDIAKSIKER